MKKYSKGFTMIELVVAISLFAIIVPTLSVAIRNLVVLNNRARDLALASLLAESRVEILRSAGYNSLSVGTVDFTSQLPSALASPRSATYAITLPEAGIKEITVTISYKDYNRTTTKTYKTIVSELGVGQ